MPSLSLHADPLDPPEFSRPHRPMPRSRTNPLDRTPPPDFDPGSFARRRARVLDDLGDDAMVLPAAPPVVRSGDSELPYRPDSELYYLTGWREPEALLVLRGFADEDREVLFVRERDPKVERWTGLRMGPDAAGRRLGIETTEGVGGLDERLPELLKGAERVQFRLGRNQRVQRLVEAALDEARSRGARTGRGPRGVLDPGGILDELRLTKDDGEIASIREAARISALGFRAAFEQMEPGAGEWEVEAALVRTFRSEGAQAPAFAPIVAAGTNACVLHYIENGARMQDGDLVLIDAGAEYRMYAADISRTFPVSGSFTPEQRDVWSLVNRARREAIEQVAPGVPFERIHDKATRVLVEGLVELGVLEGDVDERIAEGAHKDFFPHQTSHWLGLDTHDPGDYRTGGESRTLESGMVLTVEPGLYLPPRGLFGDDTGVSGPLAGIGVRLEDDVLVTATGRDVLTETLPTDPDELRRGPASS